MTYSKDSLRQIFQQPFNQEEWQNMLRHYFHATELKAERERIDDTPDDEKGYYLGAIDTTDNYRIGLFYYQIQHGNVARKRVGLRNLVKSFINPNWGDFDAALVVFDSGSVWRLSFVCDIKGENTAVKRFTYVFGESDNYYNTPVGRFDALQRNGITFENIKDAFSVEALSKEFFDKYREHYADIVCYITGKRYVKEKGKWVEKTIQEPCHEIFDQFVVSFKNPEKTVRDYIKKLMGRLVFIQFLQKKGWLGVPSNSEDWTGGDSRFLQNKFKEFADKDNFIDGFLEPLFNDLNSNRVGDKASLQVGKDIKIPFLNGGLFQLEEEDCADVRLPQELLGALLDFFEQYNFTIDENDPNDAQIGVDPEMLGRVFENLLEDNKDKGAFYTPKEIVQYMCRESLIAYLQTEVNEEAGKEAIRQFVLTHEASLLGDKAENISIRLLNVKICDPAIGSGAFPMGLLRELYLCQCAIHPELVGKNAADIKRHIIQNNIYGVDIEKGAVDIARLRFWLSLIVDEDSPKFLPNLDFKIMQGNSLLEQYNGVDLSKMTTLSSEQQEGTQLTWFDNMLDVLRLDLRQKLDEYYNCPDHHRKEQLKNEIIDNVKQQLREQSINVDFGELDLSANDQFTLWHTWFYDVFSQGGFDIVIGNPPYIQLQANKGVLADLYSCVKFKTFVRTGDIYSLFYEKGWQILKNGGCLCFITSNKWMRAGYGEQTREFFAHYTNPEILIDFSGIDIFESATVVTNVLLFTRLENKGQTSCVATTNQDKDCLSNLHEFVRSKKYVQNLSDSDGWVILNPLELALKQKIIKVGTPLKEWDVDIYRGILTGYNDAFIISTEKRNEILENCHSERERIRTIELIKPLLRGKDIIRYGYDWANLWLINTHNGYKNIDGIDINEYPAIKRHLDNYWNKISQRGDKGVTPYNLRNCAYIDEFNKPKVIYPETTKGARFAYDDSGIYIDKTCFMLISDAALYIQKTLSSKLFEVAYNKMFSSVELVNHTYQYNKHALLKLPIIKDEDAIKQLSAIDNEQQIDLFVYHLYGLTYDEVLIVDSGTSITREEYENDNIK